MLKAEGYEASSAGHDQHFFASERSVSDAEGQVPLQTSAEFVRTYNAQAHLIVDAIAATVANAEAGLNWLRAEPPDLEEARQTLIGIASAGNRAAERQPGFLAWLQTILNVIPAYTWYAAPSGALAFVNKRTADYLGLPKDHPLRFGIDIGAQWDDWVPLLHPDDQEESRKYWSNCLRTGGAGQHNYRVRNPQGDYRWFLSSFEPLRASDGTLLLWIGATVDIEELKRAQEALRESERSARSALDGIAGHVAIMAPNGELETVNRQVLDYFGRSLEWLKNWGTNDAVHPEDLPRILELFKRAMASGIPFNFELRIRRFDGEYRWFELRGVPIRDDSGRIARWYILLTDVEDRYERWRDWSRCNRISPT
jgi:PAS domain S-box-containing protein